MPQWTNTVKYCAACGGRLTLKNQRDMVRKKYCSKSCGAATLGGPNPWVDLTDHQQQVLDGCLLGDGTVAARRGRNARFQYGDIREDVVILVVESLRPLSMRAPYVRTDISGFPNSKPFFCTYSVASPTFSAVRGRWYNGKKFIPRDLVLTPTVCLFWYLGDGGLNRDRVNLSTQGFSWEDVEGVLLPKLHSAGFTSARAYAEKGNPRVYMNPVHSEEWLSFVGECPVSSMQYKWNVSGITRRALREDGTIIRRFSDEERIDICRLAMQGHGPKFIAELHECSRNTIASMLQSWRKHAPVAA